MHKVGKSLNFNLSVLFYVCLNETTFCLMKGSSKPFSSGYYCFPIEGVGNSVDV